MPVGEKIGKYEIRERRAMGGQAIVYKCYDSLLDRFVAIKQISTHLAEDPKFLSRFRREAQIIAKLGSEQPAIVSIHELIEDRKGLFIVMEFVEGRSLETIMQEANGPVEPSAALRILWRLAAGLHAVHSAGIVHRDIKPGNIIIADGLRARITDFGVAATVTGQTSMLMGTTKYMAPELFEGEVVDGRADMYSLGFIAYEMLVGRAKFNEIFADIVRDKHAEALRWMKWHGNSRVKAPPLHEVNPAVPKALSDIVAKMMEKSPDDRFENVEMLGRAVKANFSSRARSVQRGRRESVSTGHLRSEGFSDTFADDEVLDGAGRSDRVDFSRELPATAPLPKERLSLRTKVILASIIAVFIIAMGVVAGYWINRVDSRRRDRARTDYDQGRVQYDAAMVGYEIQQFEAARNTFQRVRREHKGTGYSVQASVLAALCEAEIAALGRNWDKAQNSGSEANQLLDLARKTHGVGEGWVGKTETEIRQFERYRRNAWMFWTEIEVAEEKLRSKKFSEVRRILDERLAGVELKDPKLRQRLQDFRHRFRVGQFEADFAEHLTDANFQLDQEDFVEAKREVALSEAMLDSPEAGELSKDELARLEQILNNKKTELVLRENYHRAMKQVHVAVESGDENVELSGLVEALKSREGLEKLLDPEEIASLERDKELKSVKELKERVATLRAESAMADAHKYLEAEQYEQAALAFQESLKHKRTPEALAGLRLAQSAKQFKAFLAEAKKLQDEGKLSDALGKYRKAEELRPDDQSLKTQIRDLRCEIELAKGDRLRDQRQWDKAAQAYESARRIKPESAPNVDARYAALERHRQYCGHLDKGNAELGKGRWSVARKHFKKAQETRDTEEVRSQIKWTYYNQNLDLGKRAMAQENYDSALAYFQLAKDQVDTPQINELIEKAKQAQGR